MPKPVVEMIQFFERVNPLGYLAGVVTMSVGVLNILQAVQVVVGILVGLLGAVLTTLLILSHLGIIESKHNGKRE